MKNRFQRGGHGGVSPFFAFQDIVTSAMAVLITIIMLLALDMGEASTSGSSGEPAPAELTQRLEQLLDQLNAERTSLKTLEAAASAAQLEPGLLRGEVESLRREFAALQSASAADQQKLSTARSMDKSAVVRSSLAADQAKIEAQAKLLAEKQAEAARSLAAMQAAEEAMRQAESQLVAEQARKNELWLQPDQSKTSKEPILAVVTGNAVQLQRLDQGERKELRGRNLEKEFRAALPGYSKLDQYFVFYFKPSGVPHFDALTEAGRNAGFEIGYDAVAEEKEINFTRPK